MSILEPCPLLHNVKVAYGDDRRELPSYVHEEPSNVTPSSDLTVGLTVTNAVNVYPDRQDHPAAREDSIWYWARS